MTDTNRGQATLYYDAGCRFCTSLAGCFRSLLARHGFALAPLQTPGLAERLNIPSERLLREMLLDAQGLGKPVGGADAALYIARRIWWARPLLLVAALPGGRNLFRAAYRGLAARRTCASNVCRIQKPCNWPAAIPILCMPLVALTMIHRPAWFLMWTVAGSIYLGCKWVTFWPQRFNFHCPCRAAAYLLLWPGMDPRPFLIARPMPQFPRFRETILAGVKTLLGALLLWRMARAIPGSHPLLAGWVGMLGIIFLLHFGLFHLLAIAWRAAGIPVEPLMDNPIDARTVAEFWGRPWNRGFNDLATRFIFRPAHRAVGAPAATLLVFLASGLIHDLVISIPAHGGYGLPTAYFLIQGAALLTERALRLRSRLFTFVATAAPAFWLFHPPFVLRVILPFLKTIHAL